MDFGSLNYLAIVVAAVAGWILGAIWYGVLSAQWIAALGKTKEILAQEREARKAAGQGQMTEIMPFVLSFIAELIMAWALAALMFQVGVGPPTVGSGLLWAVFVWFGFILTTNALNNAYPMRKPALTVIDSLHWLAVLAVMSLVLSLWP
jgi:hypothetical protein